MSDLRAPPTRSHDERPEGEAREVFLSSPSTSQSPLVRMFRSPALSGFPASMSRMGKMHFPPDRKEAKPARHGPTDHALATSVQLQFVRETSMSVLPQPLAWAWRCVETEIERKLGAALIHRRRVLSHRLLLIRLL